MVLIPPAGASGGELGDGSLGVPQKMLDEDPGQVKRLIGMTRHPRAGHDRERWKTIAWDDYRAHVGIAQRRGPWSVSMVEAVADGPDAWVCAAERMPHIAGWYTALTHDERGLIMSDLPAEIAGCVPFTDRVAAQPGARVLIGGLGLGIVPAFLIRSTDAARVDVIEYEPALIGMITGDPCAREQWASDWRLHVYRGDVHSWYPPVKGCELHPGCEPAQEWDGAWWDIWDVISPGNLPSMMVLDHRYAGKAQWQMFWERPECEAMLARPSEPAFARGDEVISCSGFASM